MMCKSLPTRTILILRWLLAAKVTHAAGLRHPGSHAGTALLHGGLLSAPRGRSSAPGRPKPPPPRSGRAGRAAAQPEGREGRGAGRGPAGRSAAGPRCPRCPAPPPVRQQLSPWRPAVAPRRPGGSTTSWCSAPRASPGSSWWRRWRGRRPPARGRCAAAACAGPWPGGAARSCGRCWSGRPSGWVRAVAGAGAQRRCPGGPAGRERGEGARSEALRRAGGGSSRAERCR